MADPRMSPDGSQVAYVVTTLDVEANESRSAIWLVPSDGGHARKLTSGERRDILPRWAPDGRALAFVSDRGGAREIYLLRLDGGEPRRLTDGAGRIEEVVWAPDGRRIALVARPAEEEKDPRRRLVRVTDHRHKRDGVGFTVGAHNHVYVADVDSGAVAQITAGAWDDGQPAWSPDGRSIVFVSDRSADRDRHFEGGALHVIDVASKAVRRLTSESGRARAPSWSPDGGWIAYVGSPVADDASAADTHLWRIRPGGGEPERVGTQFGGSVGQRPGGYLTPSTPVWSGRDLLYLANTGGATHLWRFGERDEQLTRADHAVLEVTADSAGERCALLVTDATTPSEIHVGDRAGGRQLTRTNDALLNEVALGAPELIKHNGCDGWLLRPGLTDGPVPLVLSVHGGPHNFFGSAWSFDHHLYAALGWAVLYVNPRGSGGYGEAFASEVIEDWGGKDFEDLMGFVDHVIARADPPIDARRLAITGNSYGGYMTCWAVTQTARFAVGVSGACISNLASFFGTSDIGASWGAREMGEPWKAERLYRERSPITWVERVRTPLLLYHGEDDLRCPIEQSEQMFSALQRLGRPVEMLRIPRESHGALGAGSPVHRIEARRVILEWLRRYLG